MRAKRSKPLTEEQKQQARVLRARGLTLAQIARELETTESIMRRISDMPELTPEQIRAIRRDVWERGLAKIPQDPTKLPRKDAERKKSRELRADGFSIPEIAEQLKVSKGSVSVWVKDIELAPEQRKILLAKSGGILGNQALAKKSREKRLLSQEQGRKKTSELWKMGCVMYWAEGAKAKNVVSFSNTDPYMLKFFVGFLEKELDIKKDQFRPQINVYLEDEREIDGITTYWSELLEIPKEGFIKPQINNLPSSSSGKKKGRHPYGCLQLRVSSTDAVQQIYGGIQEIFGFIEPKWLA